MPNPIRDPWPYDILYGNTGLMLGAPDRKQPSNIVISKPQDLTQVAPPTFGYDALNPQVEKVYSYDDLSGGYGQKIHAGGTKSNRYYYALNADCSIGAPLQKGPAVTQLTPATTDATNGITQFFEIGGSIYALAGRYCLYRASDGSWPVSKDFGAGKVSFNALTLYYNNGGANLAYVGMGDSEPIWKFTATTNTTTWTQSVEAFYARDWVTSGREVWRSTAVNQLSKCDIDADPFVLANWTTANTYNVGDKQYPINRLAVTVSGTPLALKTDGVYSLDPDGFDHNLYPYLHLAAAASGGKYYGYWQNDIYMGYGNSCLRIKPTLSLGGSAHLPVEEIGPERIVDNDSPVHGQPTAACGHEDFNLYQGLYNSDTGNSYLLKFGAWAEDPNGAPTRLEVWHGSITAAFTAKKITAMYKSTIGAPTDHARMYLGFSDGTVAWFTLPCTPNPAACSSYTYATADGTIYLPEEDLNFRNDSKVIKAFTVSGTNLSTTDYVQIQYQSDPSYGFNTLTDAASVNISFNQTPRQKVWLPSAVAGTLPQFAIILKTASGTSPQVTGLGVHYVVRFQPVYQYQLDVLCDQVMLRRDRVPMTLFAQDVRDLVKNTVNANAPTRVTMPDESVKYLSIIDYQEVQTWSELLHSWRAGLRLQCVDFTPIQTTVYGTLERLEAYTLEQLENYTLEQLENL